MLEKLEKLKEKYGEPDEELAKFIQGLPAQMKKDMQRFKEEAESDMFKQKADDTIAEMEAAIEAEEAEEEEAAA